MVHKKHKGFKARNADSGSAPQDAASKPQKPQQLHPGIWPPKPKPDPRPQPKPKPAALKTSTGKTEHCHPAKPNNTLTRTRKLSGSPAQTAVKIDEAGNSTGGQTPFVQKKPRRNMARGKKNNKAAPARNPQTAMLELPEGYVPPKKSQSGKSRQKARSKSPGKAQAPAQYSAPYSSAILPWRLDPEYVSD